MDRKTFTHYGWIVVCSLTLAILIAFATPFGKTIGEGIKTLASNYEVFSDSKFSDANKEELQKEFDELFEVNNQNTP